MAERVRALNNPNPRLVLDTPATVVFGEAQEADEGRSRPHDAEG